MNRKAMTLRAGLMALMALASACGQIPIGSDDSGTPGMSTLPQATTSTPATAQDATSPSCRIDADCRMVRDFCAATCGVCRALDPSVATPSCLPPANVRCADVCAGRVAVCQSGQCALR